MRRRDGLALGGSFALALGGVLVLPLGAAAEPTVTHGPSPSASPSAGSQAAEETPTPSASAEPTPMAPTPSETTDPSPSTGPADVRAIDDAVFTWSINKQSNAQSHNPITDNFFAAGEANPGRGGMVLTESRWQAKSGNVEIQKLDAEGAWNLATWDGLGTDAKGDDIGLYGPFSGHRVRISDGSGILDHRNDDATLQWKGTFTVVYYGGNTVFTLTDPKLTVRKGVGQLTATAGGWASDRFDPTVWQPVTPGVVPVAELRDVDVTETGITVTPGYQGVEVVGPEPQLRTGEGWGSFPQEFVTFIEPMGAAQFWYSTGLQSDWTKLPDPIRVGWSGAEPEETREDPVDGSNPAPTNKVTRAPEVPAQSATPVLQAPRAPTTTVAPPVTVPAPGQPMAAAEDPVVPGGVPVQVTAAAPAELALAAGAPSDPSPAWFLGGSLLLGAALLLVVPVAPRLRR